MAIMGGVAGGKLSFLIAQATVGPEHPWVSLLIGPMGGLIAALIGLYWMNLRLKRADDKADKNEAMLLDLMERVTTSVVTSTEAVKNSTLAIQRNTDYLEDSNEVLRRIKPQTL